MREFPAFCLLFMRKKANDRGNKYIRQILAAFHPLRMHLSPVITGGVFFCEYIDVSC